MEPYARSFARFVELAGGNGRPVPEPVARPLPDDDAPGPSLFRTLVEDCSLRKLNLPGLFVGRSELIRVDLSGSALRLSSILWSDLTDCWLAGCDLRDSGLLASTFVRCNFSRASLIGCDLRHSTFVDCRLAGADVSGAVLPGRLRAALALAPPQAASAVWVDDEGPEPPGG